MCVCVGGGGGGGGGVGVSDRVWEHYWTAIQWHSPNTAKCQLDKKTLDKVSV